MEASMNSHTYIAIDLKSFYASVECIERNLDPLTTNLVVADAARTEKTICLAVSPSLKTYGIPGRARLFEVIQKIKEANSLRKYNTHLKILKKSSYNDSALKSDPSLAVDFITAPPQMALYMKYSKKIYELYLKYIAPEDIHIYSIDEVFIDVTPYLNTYKLSAKALAMKIINEVLATTGITATAGIGTNLYLCKIAMDIQAKHVKPDANGVRIAMLDEISYRQNLWAHRPLTDFWRIGKGYVKKLEKNGLYTMGDIARCSLGKKDEFHNERLLYKLFGINAELLIDHAWGWEPCTIKNVKEYKPDNNSLSSGQVLQCPYPFEKAKIVIREMAELLVFDLIGKNFVTDQIVLTIGYDIENIASGNYNGETATDYYGRKIPKHAHGTATLEKYSSSTKIIVNAVMQLSDKILNPSLSVRRINVTANHIVDEKSAQTSVIEQYDLFADTTAIEKETNDILKEKKQQKTILAIKGKHGKNAILMGSDLQAGATTILRNKQIGGHKA